MYHSLVLRFTARSAIEFRPVQLSLDAFQGNVDYSALFARTLTFLVFCEIKNDDDEDLGFSEDTLTDQDKLNKCIYHISKH